MKEWIYEWIFKVWVWENLWGNEIIKRQFGIREEQETEIKGTMKEVFQERSTVLKVLHSCDLAFFISTFSIFFYYWCFCLSMQILIFFCYKKLQLKFNVEGNIYVKHESRVLWLKCRTLSSPHFSSLYLKACSENLKKHTSWSFPPFTFTAPVLNIPHMSDKLSELLSFSIASKVSIFKYALSSLTLKYLNCLTSLPFWLDNFQSSFKIQFKDYLLHIAVTHHASFLGIIKLPHVFRKALLKCVCECMCTHAMFVCMCGVGVCLLIHTMLFL